MQKIGEKLVVSAHDLISVMECEHRNILNKLVTDGVLSKPETVVDENLKLIQDLGIKFEKRELKRLKDSGFKVIELPEVGVNGDKHKNYLTAYLQTIEAIKQEPDYIYQAVLYTDYFLGYVDFLQVLKNEKNEIIRDSSGQPIYEPVDTKLARSAKRSAVVQVGIYAEVMTHVGLAKPKNVHLWLGNDTKVSYKSEEIIPLAKQLFERIENLHNITSSLPSPLWGEKKTVCDMCIWNIHCEEKRISDDDVSLVYGTRIETRRKLRDSGFNTVEKLAKADQSDKPYNISKNTFEKLQNQAKLQFNNRNQNSEKPVHEIISLKELTVMPPRNIGDVWFDMEGDPYAEDGSGLEYLFGLVHLKDDLLIFKTFGATNKKEEKKAFEDFIDWIIERSKTYPEMHIYHYAHYENTTLKRLALNYQTRQDELDEILKKGLLVDLYKIVKKTFRFSTTNLSLKTIEKIYGEKHEGNVTSGSDSIIKHQESLKLRLDGQIEKADEILKNIYDYNQLDCESTKKLDDWIRQEATNNGVTFKSKALLDKEEFVDDPNENEKDPDPVEERLTILNAYLEGAKEANWDKNDIQGLEILIGSLTYHKQEKLPAWWQHFERVKAEEDELIDDNGVVFVEEALPGHWTKEGKQRSYRRNTQIISNGFGLADVFSNGEEVFALYDEPYPYYFSTLSDSDRAFNKAKVHSIFNDWFIEEKSKAGEEGWPKTALAILPGPPIDTKNLTKVLVNLADETIKRLESGLSPFAAVCWADIAKRISPRNLDNKALPRESQDDIQNCVTAIENSDNSYVAVQGPPGSGKTYLGTRVIAELIRLGYKIGIVAQSHTVIENVIDKLYELDPTLPIAKKQHHFDEENKSKPWHTQNIDVFASLQNSGYAIGGTTWNFSKDSIKQLDLDLMVIEEAGQFALANTLIVSSMAKKTLMLGDPQQLEQVSQALHIYPVDKSALGHILKDHKTIPDELGYFLSKTYRMHSKLTKPVSILQYENRLKSAPKTDERDLEGVEPGLHKISLAHYGNTTRSDEEASEVVDLVNQLIGKSWTDEEGTRRIEETDILVVAAYNNQVRAIKQHLKKNDLSKVRVGTVDKFQGQEAPLSILSMATSSGEDLPRGVEFLLQANRLNVAISRAKWASFIVYSKELLNIDPTTVEAVQRLGSFIGLISSANEWKKD